MTKPLNLIFLGLLGTLLAIWVIPHTMALRLLCGVCLLGIIVYFKPDWRTLWPSFSLVLIWIGYVAIYPCFAPHGKEALHELPRWLRSFSFIFIGAGTGLILKNKLFPKDSSNLDLKIFTFASTCLSIPIFIHLFSVILLWGWGISLATYAWPDWTFFNVPKELRWHWSSFPFNYWGIEDHHANLGYVSLFIGVFSSITLATLLSIPTKPRFARRLIFLHLFILIACLLSLVIAKSRAGILFYFASIFLSSLIWLLTNKRIKELSKVFFCTCILILIGAYSTYQIDSTRWDSLITSVDVHVEINPSNIICDGYDLIKNQLELNGVSNFGQFQGDLDRILADKMGLELVLKNPLGLDASKSAYSTLIFLTCNKSPTNGLPHAHNGWINLLLAIGIPGGLILLCIFESMIFYSVKLLRGNSKPPFAVALLTLSILWSLRGLTDAVYRDHMLEMQYFFFALLTSFLIKSQKSIKET